MMFFAAVVVQLSVPPVKNDFTVRYSPPRYYICREKCPEASAIHIIPVIKPSLKISQTEKLTVYFDFDSAELKKSEKKKIESFIKKIKTPVAVIGYADCIGSKKYNRRLSERRAAAVRKYIEEIGGKVLKALGKGELPPPPGPEKRKVEIRGEK